MDRDQAITFALSRHPDSIGVARLCQELLADVAGKPVKARSAVVVPVCARPRRSEGPSGKCNNPFGCAGKPK